MLSFDRHLDVIATAVGQIAAVASRIPLDTLTLTAPEWDVRALVHHQGEVHRLATAVLAHRATSHEGVPDEYLGALPADDDLVAWFVAGADRLADTLRSADSDVAYMTFHRHVPTTRRDWWARRQAHETTVHAMDAASAVGPIADVPTDIAADGLDEFLRGFLPRPRTQFRRDVPSRLRIVADDAGAAWTVVVSNEMPVTTYDGDVDGGSFDAVVRGPAAALYPCVWNRAGLDRITVEGDASLFEELRDQVRIRWS